METDDRHWRAYYHGSRHDIDRERRYSFSDRIRYYWSTPEVKMALERLTANLRSRTIPLSLLSQYLPLEYLKVREGMLSPTADELITSHIMQVTESYAAACRAGRHTLRENPDR
jgi:D-tagatose-1,6-bisphosphate aldolase subunit GatZ/KbaZ